MKSIEVVVEGGGANLYEIREYEGRFTAYKVSVNLLMSNSRRSIGAVRSLEAAITLIRSHSGREIKSMNA